MFQMAITMQLQLYLTRIADYRNAFDLMVRSI